MERNTFVCFTVVELCLGEGRKQVRSLQNQVSKNFAFSQASLIREAVGALSGLDTFLHDLTHRSIAGL
jgi:hypothetical protein